MSTAQEDIVETIRVTARVLRAQHVAGPHGDSGDDYDDVMRLCPGDGFVLTEGWCHDVVQAVGLIRDRISQREVLPSRCEDVKAALARLQRLCDFVVGLATALEWQRERVPPPA